MSISEEMEKPSPLLVTTATSKLVRSILWTFDSDFKDLYSVYNGVPMSGANLSSSVGINGYGKALSVARASSQYVTISSPALLLANDSFTIEAWVYPGSTIGSNDFLIFTQCSVPGSTPPNCCLQAMIRYSKPFIGFGYGGDFLSSSTLSASKWTHLAFVHDLPTRTQLIYINGRWDGSLNISTVYVGSSAAPLLIGGSVPLGMYFDGLIDELSITTRAKTAAEILEDATLAARYPFDSNSPFYDSGETFRGVSAIPRLSSFPRTESHQWNIDQCHCGHQRTPRLGCFVQSNPVLLSGDGLRSLWHIQSSLFFLLVAPSFRQHRRNHSARIEECLVSPASGLHRFGDTPDASSFISEPRSERQLHHYHSGEHVDTCRPDLFAHHGHQSLHQWNTRRLRGIDHFQFRDISDVTSPRKLPEQQHVVLMLAWLDRDGTVPGHDRRFSCVFSRTEQL